MEEQLIEAVKKHEELYKKSSILYSNKFKRAAAWKSIAEELNVPENVCQSRWKTLRDRFVKKCAENYHASGSGAEVVENQWPYQRQMEFLREHIKPRRTITSTQPIQKKNADENSADASYFSLLEDDQSEIIETIVDTSFLYGELATSPVIVPTLDTESSSCPVDMPHSSRKKPRRENDNETFNVPTFDTESSSCPVDTPHSSRKKPRRENDSEAFNEFLKKMSQIAETRFAVPTSQKESAHEGFFSMVREIFDELPSDVVKEAKFFFINYLHDQVAANKKD